MSTTSINPTTRHPSWTPADTATLHAHMSAFPVIGDSEILAFYLRSEGIEL